MILESDLDRIIAAASARATIILCGGCHAIVKTAIVEACRGANPELTVEEMIASIAEYPRDVASIRCDEVEFWISGEQSLINAVRNMIFEAVRADVAANERIDMATIFVFVGYAIRVGRHTKRS